MNRGLVVALALATLLAVAFAAPSDEKYTDKYDNVNLDDILGNDRLFRKYLECLLADSDAHCTADGKELRKAIPDALTNECSKCSDKHKQGTKRVIKHLREHKNAEWEKLQAKWDPEGIYRSKYADKVKELD